MLFIVLAVIFISFYFAIYRHQINNISSFLEIISTNKMQIEKLESDYENLHQNQNEISALKSNIKQFENTISDYENIWTNILEISKAIYKFNLSRERFGILSQEEMPNDLSENIKIIKTAVQVNLSGDLSNTLNFINYINQNEKFYAIENIEFKSSNLLHNAIVNCNITFSAYSYKLND